MVYPSSSIASGGIAVQVIRRIFLASLFFVITVILTIWFYPGISEEFSSFNSSVQGGVGSDTSAYFWALNALDIGAALLCASALFYGGMLIARRKKTKAAIPEPAPAKPGGKKATNNRRLLLIPAWFLAQYIWNLFSGMSAVQALSMMTTINSLWISAVVITAIVLYANDYQVVFGKDSDGKPSNSPTKPGG